MTDSGLISTFPKEPSKKVQAYFTGTLPNHDDFMARFFEYTDRLSRLGWHRLGSGRHRTVFLSPKKDKVIKVSHNGAGVMANYHEHYFASKGKELTLLLSGEVLSKIPLPKVYGLARVGHKKWLSVLCVEFVDRTYEGWALARELPWIHDVDVDSYPQIGYTHEGRLVCFDWARF